MVEDIIKETIIKSDEIREKEIPIGKCVECGEPSIVNETPKGLMCGICFDLYIRKEREKRYERILSENS